MPKKSLDSYSNRELEIYAINSINRALKALPPRGRVRVLAFINEAVADEMDAADRKGVAWVSTGEESAASRLFGTTQDEDGASGGYEASEPE